MTIVLDRYEVGESLGKGGFGEVFRARRTDLDRIDAIKVLHEQHCRDGGAVVRFVAEARAASKIDHPGIVRVYDLGTLPDGRAYCVMECLKGRTLRALLDERGPLPLAEAQPMLAKIAAAIDAAHAVGVAHRDLKPENVFVEPDGSIRVIDFGLAKLAGDIDLTTTGHVMGSPRYMSPEQCRGKGADTRSDLYSFGALAYHVLAGKPPFEGDALALALHHLNDAPAVPSGIVPGLSASVDHVLLALLAKDPEKRPRPLALAVAGLTSGVLPQPRGSRRWFAIAAGGGVVAAALIGGFVVMRGDREGTPTPDPIAPPPLRLVASFPVDRVEGPFLHHDPHKLVNSHDDKSWELIEYEKPDRPKTLIRWGQFDFLPDGRELVAENVTPMPQLVLMAGDHRTEIAKTMSGPALSPDGTQIAFVGEAGVQIYDIARQSLRTLVGAQLSSGVSWSPSGKRLIWVSNSRVSAAENRIMVADVATGAAIQLDVPLLQDFGQSNAVFTDDEHFLYCAMENGRATLRLRSTALVGGLGDVIRTLDAHTADCTFSRSRDRVSVGLVSGRREIAALDLKTRRPRAIGIPFDKYVRTVAPTGALITADGADAFDPTTARALPPPRSCAPKPTVVVRNGERLERWNVSQQGTQVLVSMGTDTCEPIGEWILPDPPSTYNGLRCESGLCVLPTYKDGVVRLWAFEVGRPSREIGKLPVDTSIAVSDVMVEVAPGGKHLAVAIHADKPVPVWLLATDGSSRKQLPSAPSIEWVDSTHVLLSPMTDASGVNGPVIIGLDGTTDKLWSSNQLWFFGLIRGPDGTIYGDVKDMHIDVSIYEVAR